MVIMGSVVQTGGGKPSASKIWGGMRSVGAATVNKVCGSGAKAAMLTGLCGPEMPTCS
jgi:acetyl-CoA acetyltransferase